MHEQLVLRLFHHFNDQFSFAARENNISFFLGKSGTVVIDKKGDRTPIYELHNYQYGEKIFLCKFDTETHECQISAKILWPDGGSSPPKDSPACGFNNEKCTKNIGKAL